MRVVTEHNLGEKGCTMPIATLWHVTLRAIQDWWHDNCLRGGVK